MLTLYSQTYKPLQYPDLDRFRKVSENIHWIVEEVNMAQDLEDYKTADSFEKEFIKNILSIFTQSDFNVANGYLPLINHIKNNEARGMLTSFMAREFIHQEAYAHLNESLGFPDSYYTDFLKHQETAEKNSFMSLDDKLTFEQALAKNVLLEGISLFGSFIMLKNFERTGKYPGMCSINEWSLRDETLHVEGNSTLFNLYCEQNNLTSNTKLTRYVYKIIEEIVKLEKNFIDFAFSTYNPSNLTNQEVKDYIEYIADRRLLQLHFKPHFKRKDNPIPWMDEINNPSSHSNFFEKQPTDYAVASLKGKFSYKFTNNIPQ